MSKSDQETTESGDGSLAGKFDPFQDNIRLTRPRLSHLHPNSLLPTEALSFKSRQGAPKVCQGRRRPQRRNGVRWSLVGRNSQGVEEAEGDRGLFVRPTLLGSPVMLLAC